MPLNTELANKVWCRYVRARDTGHLAFVQKATLCTRFFCGDQWSDEDRAHMRKTRRPYLTINKILSTISNMMGEQIYNRSEIAYRPKAGATAEVADALTKVYKHISDANMLDWLRSDMFADGIITSRGFLDIRLGFTDSLQGEVQITKPNPKNVIIDPDADSYDPDTWNEVMITKWMTVDDIEVLYSKKDADLLRSVDDDTYFPYGIDSADGYTDRFGATDTAAWANNTPYEENNVRRSIRVIERQHRVLTRQEHFIDVNTGDMRPVPDEWSAEQIEQAKVQYGYEVVPKMVKRIRWTVISGAVVLHDAWSPYKRFTIIPFFPHFRDGRPIGMVENLIGPQELLNKVSSQELHVVNTTANSGYKVRTGALTTMSVEELEQRGSETGLVIELNNSLEDVEKLTPNPVPTGLDRISYKAEEHIKTISGVSDSQQGMDREDVAAKAIMAKRQAASTNMAKPLDSMVRTDFMLARALLDIIQSHYTEPRVLAITHSRDGGGVDMLEINQPTPEGTIVNDLTLGEYAVTISSVPQRDSLEDSQFEQATTMRRDLGVQIPDEYIIGASRLLNKNALLRQMAAEKKSPEAQAANELSARSQQAEVNKVEAETAQKQADSQLKQAKAEKEKIAAQRDAMTPIEGENGEADSAMMKAQAEIALMEKEFELKRQMAEREFELKKQEALDKQTRLAAESKAKITADRVAAATAAAKDTQPVTNKGA